MSDYRDRSRSPYQAVHGEDRSAGRRHRHHRTHSRSRSPHRKESKRRPGSHSKPLPSGALPLAKYDLPTYRPLFTLYLDIQKQLDIEDLPEEEVKGRWKSFIKKWNAGDLAVGWYDPTTFEKANASTFDIKKDHHKEQRPTASNSDVVNHGGDDCEDSDDFGPSLPASSTVSTHTQRQSAGSGPSIPSFSDIRARNEQIQEEAEAMQEAYIEKIRSERKADRKQQKDWLEELVPRSDPGSRERQLEKKRDTAVSNKAFAVAKEGGGDMELRDADVMGDADSLGELKRLKALEERKKTERELRREESLRTRAAEREERMKGLREKEAKTMEMLKSIAKARFGRGGNAHSGG